MTALAAIAALPACAAVIYALLTGPFGAPGSVQLALESQADLVVMGVRGRSPLDLALFGSTTQRVIQLGSCPVLVVHT